MTLSLQDQATQAFTDAFGRPPDVLVRASGRVNLIGEHTDYNDGFVMPMAIDRAVWIALCRTDDGQVHVQGVDMGDAGVFSLSDVKEAGPPLPEEAAEQGWLEYLKGTAWSLMDAGHTLTGWQGPSPEMSPSARACRRRRHWNWPRPEPLPRSAIWRGTRRSWPGSANAPRISGWASTVASWTR